MSGCHRFADVAGKEIPKANGRPSNNHKTDRPSNNHGAELSLCLLSLFVFNKYSEFLSSMKSVLMKQLDCGEWIVSSAYGKV
jgi:hypothetical protein